MITSQIITKQMKWEMLKDVQSQRLTVHCHSGGLSTKNEQELGLGLESMVKIIDPLPIPNRQSKMLPGWVWGFKKAI